MDVRQWLLLNSKPKPEELWPLVRHVPSTECRSPRVLALYEEGVRTGFKLSDSEGRPTSALHLMVSQMKGVNLCQARDLQPEERKAFGLDGPELASLMDDQWYLRGITPRIKAAFSSLNSWTHQWVWDFLPNLNSAYVRYKDPDGKRRKRVCYIARVGPDWGMTGNVYGGYYRWIDDHIEWGSGWYKPKQWPDAYTLLGQRAADDKAPVQDSGDDQTPEACSVEAAGVPADSRDPAGSHGGAADCPPGGGRPDRSGADISDRSTPAA